MGYERFGSQELLDVIMRLADRDRLSLIVGAGVSVESGLPDWRTLIANLLVTAARSEGLTSEDSVRFAKWTLQREDVTGAGEIGRQLLGDSFRSNLHNALYEGKTAFAPGETALAVASIRLDRVRSVCEVVTTNYDGLLEAALRSEVKERSLDGLSVVRLVDDRTTPSSQIGVRHLHGSLTPGNQLVGSLVLSDRDYHLMQDSGSWQESFFRNQLTSNTCLFVGMSLSDPNLLRYIYRSGGEGDHVAVFARQQDASLYDSAGDDVVGLREDSQARKWKAVNVSPVLVDYYSQSAQFLWEIRAAYLLGSSYRPLPERLQEWNDDLAGSVLTRHVSTFQQNQDRLHSIMAGALQSTLKLIHRRKLRLGWHEKLGISLWIYDPAEDALINWASGDRVWRNPATLEPIPVEWSSDFVATQAFCSGSMVSQSTDQYLTTRWNHVIGFPIYIHAKSGRLPVGAVTIASTKSQEHSVLSRGIETVRNQAIPEISALAELLLSPSATSDS